MATGLETKAAGMGWRNSTERYGPVTMALHWTILVLFVVQYALAYYAKLIPGYESSHGAYLIVWHRLNGTMILLLVLVRIWWRAVNPQPPLPTTMSPAECLLAHCAHWALYAVMLVQPLTGLGMDVLRGRPLAFFEVTVLPPLVKLDTEVVELIADTVHNVIMAPLIAGLVTLHVLAALKHHFIDRDDVLLRMLPPRR